MLTIGLTGGIGAGKSAVLALFAAKGVPIVDADVIAHAITQADQALFPMIVQHFGVECLLPNGQLNRKKIREIIFNDKNERQWLEQTLHPLILEQMQATIKQSSAPYCIAAIPLLIEVGIPAFIDRVLVVDAPETLQIERVSSRDGTSPTEVATIIQTQVTRKQRLAAAQDVIINDSNIEALKPQVDRLHSYYLSLTSL
jgi:dephospho-CoA kinase